MCEVDRLSMVAMVLSMVLVVKLTSNASISAFIFTPCTTRPPLMVTLLSMVVVSVPRCTIPPSSKCSKLKRSC